MPPDSADHGRSVVSRDRRHAEDDVLEDLGEDATKPEHDHGSELAVLVEPDDHLGPSREHLLHTDALDESRRRSLCHCGDDAPVTASHGLIAEQVELYPADIALVDDVGRHDLERDRDAHPSRKLDRLRGVGGDAVEGDGKAVTGDSLESVGHGRSALAR